MPEQIEYYNRFGELYKNAILSCPEPHLWTTDYDEKGRVYQEIKTRIELQKMLVDRHFQKTISVFDVGCGFGRQAYLLARNGFPVIGTDTSKVFIEIARLLFQDNDLKGTFFCKDILAELLEGNYRQVLLLDVLEHIPPRKRKLFLQKIQAITVPGSLLILSLPHVKKRLSSQINNRIRKAITHHFSYFRNREEHPYPIPQKGGILQLVEPAFGIKEFITTNDTDYYVLERR
jgi:2-polyprenyl-3-methyl-5-hydroxy-6-metoxy-1,4-benzoquinol methylase